MAEKVCYKSTKKIFTEAALTGTLGFLTFTVGMLAPMWMGVAAGAACADPTQVFRTAVETGVSVTAGSFLVPFALALLYNGKNLVANSKK